MGLHGHGTGRHRRSTESFIGRPWIIQEPQQRRAGGIESPGRRAVVVHGGAPHVALVRARMGVGAGAVLDGAVVPHDHVAGLVPRHGRDERRVANVCVKLGDQRGRLAQGQTLEVVEVRAGIQIHAAAGLVALHKVVPAVRLGGRVEVGVEDRVAQPARLGDAVRTNVVLLRQALLEAGRERLESDSGRISTAVGGVDMEEAVALVQVGPDCVGAQNIAVVVHVADIIELGVLVAHAAARRDEARDFVEVAKAARQGDMLGVVEARIAEDEKAVFGNGL
ncbi:hypothetical protein F503_07054 [Ophiostoma piceae UAMH 11346]|uniref:Uncharacterized protein n=1 Tax=Ophiostoma piceae (strain UAMH 11346) TaxID=1262450 RepID=S3CRN2_OPHP1|nr:hypothetical protein F503_07054 [Ophiostoma piceae UAMH 11346]